MNENQILFRSQYIYLSRSAFLVGFTDPNKQLPNVKSVLNFLIVDLVCKIYRDLLDLFFYQAVFAKIHAW